MLNGLKFILIFFIFTGQLSAQENETAFDSRQFDYETKLRDLEVENRLTMHPIYIHNDRAMRALLRQNLNMGPMPDGGRGALHYSFTVPKKFIKKFHQLRAICEDFREIVNDAIYPLREQFGHASPLPYYLPQYDIEEKERRCSIEMPSFDAAAIRNFQRHHAGEVFIQNREHAFDLLWWPKYQKALIRHFLAAGHAGALFYRYGLKLSFVELPKVPLMNGPEEFRPYHWTGRFNLQVLPQD